MSWIVWVGGGAAALISIYKVVSMILSWVRSITAFISGIDKNVKKLMKHDDEQYLAILRLIVTSTDMPMSERLIAGKTYIDKGGNGDVKHLYHELEKQCNQ